MSKSSIKIKSINFLKEKPLYIYENPDGSKGASYDLFSILINKEKLKEYDFNKRIL